MRLLKYLFGHRSERPTAPAREVRGTHWQVFDNSVMREIEYFGWSPLPVKMRLEATFRWSSIGLPFLSFDVRFAAPGLAAESGFLSMRWQAESHDSGFVVVRLDKSPDSSTIVNVVDRASVAKIIAVHNTGEPMELWLGGEGGVLLQLPVPPEDGLNALLDQAAKHPTAKP